MCTQIYCIIYNKPLADIRRGLEGDYHPSSQIIAKSDKYYLVKYL